MRLSREGWHRNHGEFDLFKRPLKEATVESSDVAIGYDEMIIQPWDVAEGRPNAETVQIKFRVDTSNRPLNGEYLLRLTLSRKDIALLARESLKSASGKTIFAALSV
jgi:hypothetical protein